MRVIAIVDGYSGTYSHPIKVINKGSIYHVTGSFTAEDLHKLDPSAPPGAFREKYYSLLETSGTGIHWTEQFLEIPDDNILSSEKIEETILHNQN